MLLSGYLLLTLRNVKNIFIKYLCGASIIFENVYISSESFLGFGIFGLKETILFNISKCPFLIPYLEKLIA